MKHTYRGVDLDIRETKDGYYGGCNQDLNRQWEYCPVYRSTQEEIIQLFEQAVDKRFCDLASWPLPKLQREIEKLIELRNFLYGMREKAASEAELGYFCAGASTGAFFVFKCLKSINTLEELESKKRYFKNRYDTLSNKCRNLPIVLERAYCLGDRMLANVTKLLKEKRK